MQISSKAIAARVVLQSIVCRLRSRGVEQLRALGRTAGLVALAWVAHSYALAQPSITLTNTTRGGSQYFVVGDGFLVTISGGQTGAAVTMAWNHNGVGGGPASIGTSNGSGGFSLSGTEDTASIGTWTETWFVGGVQATPVLAFTVLGTPSVTLTNTTTGNASVFSPGDGYRISITGGLPGAAVTLAYNQNNGNNVGNYSPGTTDGSGAFQLTGTESTNEIGTWMQTWYVGSPQVQATPTLSFSVTPGCPSLVTGTPPRLFWDTTYWHYIGSMSTTGITAAFNAWMGVQSKISFASHTTDIDIYISDATGDPDWLGLTYTWDYANGGSQCNGHPSSSCGGLCANSSKVYYATIALNPIGISTSAGQWSVTTDTLITQTMSHEIGHVLGLNNHTDTLDCASPSLMYVSALESLQCGFYTPTTCDANAVNNLYSGWTTWSFSTCGPTCNLNANCS